MKLILPLVVLLILLTLAVPALEGLNTIAGRRAAEAPEPLEGAARGEDASATSEASTKVERDGVIYRWRDADGTLHIETNPPPAGVRHDTIEYRRTVDAPAGSVPAAVPAQPEPQAPRGGATMPFGVYSREGMRELMEKVDETAREIEARDELMESLREQL